MHIVIHGGNPPTAIAPATLLGHNLELAADTGPGMLSERLINPKFTGPAHPLTGIAPEWQPAMSNNVPGMRYELTQGMFLSGGESQLMHNFGGRPYMGILQTERWVRAGEPLEVELWARVQHHPVTLHLMLRPWHANAPAYDTTTITVDASYWKPYRCTLTAPCDDTEAVFACLMQEAGMVWLDQVHLRPAGSGPLRQELLEQIRSLQIPVLRFPGGCITTLYHWRFGTGPAHLRPVLPDPVFKWDVNYEFGTDEYLAMCQEMGIQPQISINLGTSTPEETEEWAAYCAEWYRRRGLPLPEIYWGIGNEQWGSWEVGNLTGEMYVAALRDFVPRIRAAYPRSRIVAMGVTTGQGYLADDSSPWRQPLLEQVPDLFDLLSLQLYSTGWDSDLAVQQEKIFQGARGLLNQIDEVIADCRAHGLQKPVAVTEWNLWLHAGHYDGKGFLEPYDVQHGLYVAGMLMAFTRRVPELELATFYHLLNPMGVFISRGPQVEETPLAAVFRLFRPAYPGEILPITVESPMLVEDIPLVDAVCLRTPDATWLLATNRSLREEAEITLDRLPAVHDGLMLVGDSPLGGFTAVAVESTQERITLPPLSIARFRLGN